MSSPENLASNAPPPPETTKSILEGEVETRPSDRRPPFILTLNEVKLLGIAGVGFFLDAYDLFIINPVATMLQYRLYGGAHLPPNLEGFVKAGANIGSVIGQFGFDGKELMLIIFATIMTLTTPTGQLSPDGALIYLGVWRIILGIGVGGDYPMSASVTSDRANLRKRGTMLSYIFSMQGWGSFMGSLATIVVLLIYKSSMEGENGKISKVDGVWRIVVGISLIPAFGTLYQRLTLGESTRYEESRKLKSEEDELRKAKKASAAKDADIEEVKEDIQEERGSSVEQDVDVRSLAPEDVVKVKAHFSDFYRHFKQWKNAKMLLATSLTWFLLDVAFYGVNLNQNVVLQQIGFDGKSGSEWNRLFKVSTGNLIVTALGFVPGYYVTVLTIEVLGRKWIQIQGFLMAALFLGILAGLFETLSKVQFIVCFAFLQFFFNFGANAAASGKAGAILSALAFNSLSKKIGTPACLWIFFACCIAGAAVTLLLPEVKGRDPDLILAEEIREKRKKAGLDVDVDA
ncbi:hypothetical protein EST38_g11007 [Candolleomyces aberdarensis]|uniref:Major facilitator superfamily (MFS) profile domain-containing protein n=1 Tax=Candolleomyces aberdarensis TaxID=2316362 RepID=A0A4Q2D984_9AGAR|nr:hypothetical protein EST38_g11007 [Candolleomyces aberdarensis]